MFFDWRNILALVHEPSYVTVDFNGWKCRGVFLTDGENHFLNIFSHCSTTTYVFYYLSY